MTRYIETTTIVQTDKNGRLVRTRRTTYIRGDWRDNGERITNRPMTEDEYFTRKSFDCMSRSSTDRISEAYRDYRSTYEWD